MKPNKSDNDIIIIVNHRILEKMNFGPYFQRWIDVMYTVFYANQRGKTGLSPVPALVLPCGRDLRPGTQN